MSTEDMEAARAVIAALEAENERLTRAVLLAGQYLDNHPETAGLGSMVRRLAAGEVNR